MVREASSLSNTGRLMYKEPIRKRA
jgi:hypothetical protein